MTRVSSLRILFKIVRGNRESKRSSTICQLVRNKDFRGCEFEGVKFFGYARVRGNATYSLAFRDR